MNKIKPRTDKCCVPGCRVNDSSCKIHLYSFPARNHNLEKRAKWIKAINRVNDDGSLWQPSLTSRICSQHFVGGKKSEHPRSPAYLPTIFPEQYYCKQKRTEAAQSDFVNKALATMEKSITEVTVKAEPETQEDEGAGVSYGEIYIDFADVKKESLEHSEKIHQTAGNQETYEIAAATASARDEVLNKALIMINKPVDDAQIFGNFVASSIRNLRSDNKKRMLKRKIQTVILQIENLDEQDQNEKASPPMPDPPHQMMMLN